MAASAAESPADWSDTLSEFVAKAKELRQQIAPLVGRVRAGELPTDAGVSHLENKLHMMLQYCASLSFYLYLKSDGRTINDHPVVTQLIQLRVMLEKLRPIDHALKYQIDKLLRSAAAPPPSSSAADSLAVEADPLTFKARPDKLVAKTHAVTTEDGQLVEVPETADGVYRPPKLSAVVDKETRKKRKQLEKVRDRALQSSLVQHLRAELSERPEEVTAMGLEEAKEDRRDAEIREFEEDNFVRLMDTKADKRRRKDAQSRIGSLGFDDFEDLSAFTERDSTPAEADDGPGFAEMIAARSSERGSQKHTRHQQSESDEFSSRKSKKRPMKGNKQRRR